MKRFALICFLLLCAAPVQAGTITVQVVETGQTTQTKTYTVADADIDKIVAAYQSGANVSVNGTATRAQVLLYWITTLLVNPTIQAVRDFNTPPPAPPPPVAFQ